MICNLCDTGMHEAKPCEHHKPKPKCWIDGCDNSAHPGNEDGLCKRCHDEREYESACESQEARRTTDRDYREE